jgi:membrane associated rhomboid family serine protease
MLLVAIIIGLLLYVSTSEERRHYLRMALNTAGQYAQHLKHLEHLRAARGPFDDALRARTPKLLVTPAVVAAILVVFLARLFATGSISDPAALVQWGANFGPLTTNGQWWRLFSAPLLYDGLMALVVGAGAVSQLGPILERQFGHSTFAAVFVAAGVFGSLMDLSAYPEAVTTSGTSAVLGLYGLLAASIVRGTLRRSELSMPLTSLVRLLPVAAIFALAVAGGHTFDLSDKAGLFTGFVSGLVVSRDLRTRKPTVQRLALVTSGAMVIAVIVSVPLRGFTDVRPELALLVALEEKTVTAYDAAVRRFRDGRETTRAMADLIHKSILPELEAAHARMKGLDRVPPAHQPVVAAARDYLRLRNESWRQRADALGKSNARLLRQADATERASLAAFEQIRAAATAAPGS